MKKGKGIRQIASLVLVLIFTIAFTGCGGNASDNNSTGGEAATKDGNASISGETPAAVKEEVNLRLLVAGGTSKWNMNRDNIQIAQEIKKRLGVTIEYVEVDNDKFNVLLAGGDLPDLIRCNPGKFGKQLITGNLIIPLDELLQTNGGEILANTGEIVEINKKIYSEGQNKVYFITPQVGLNPIDSFYTTDIGIMLRWDIYKQIGAPAIKSPDDLLNVLSEMQKKNPKTEDGKKVYGVSLFSDWGLWNYYIPMYSFYGVNCGDMSICGNLQLKKLGDTTQAYPFLQDPESIYWGSLEFYSKARRMGLLDPDALTQKFEDYAAKGTAGQILCAPAEWAMGDYNNKHIAEGKGFVCIPIEGGYIWEGPPAIGTGWTNMSLSISKNCKTPDRAMDLLNFLFSYDGARMMASGIEGVHWDYVDGKPTLRPETIELRKNGGDEWSNTGILIDANFIGLMSAQINPKDDYPVCLFESKEVYTQRVNPLEKDFSEYYGGAYPGEVYEKLIDGGKGTFKAERYLADNTLEEAIRLKTLPTIALTDDIKKIEAKLTDLAASYAAKAILAKSDEEFNELKEKAIADFIKAGADVDLQFYNDALKKNRKAAGLE